MNRSIRRSASALFATTALAIGIGASSASATPYISTNLAAPVGPTALNLYTLTVSGHVEMPQVDAELTCLSSADPADVELYGKDSGITRDELLITKAQWAARPMSCTSGATGVDYSVSIQVNGHVLDEDLAGDDELYASIGFHDIRFGQTVPHTSNVRIGNF